MDEKSLEASDSVDWREPPRVENAACVDKNVGCAIERVSCDKVLNLDMPQRLMVIPSSPNDFT